MKKNLIFSLLAGIIFIGILSFTVFKKTNSLFSNKYHKSSNCTGTLTGISSTRSGSYVTITWTYSGNPSSFNYGGYYQNNTPFPTGNTTSTSITIPYNTGGRIGIAAVCSDGSTTGNGVNTLF